MTERIVFNQRTHRYVCETCRINVLKRSILTHTNLHQIYDTDMNVRKHYDIGADTFKCVNCGHKVDEINFTEHMKQHDECPPLYRLTMNELAEVNYKCIREKCTAEPMTRDQIVAHEEIHKKLPSESFTCDIAGYNCSKCKTKMTYNIDGAIAHEQKHIKYAVNFIIDGEQFICRRCSIGCDNPEKHILEHIVCDYTFNKSGQFYVCKQHNVVMDTTFGYKHYLEHHYKQTCSNTHKCQPQLIGDSCSWCHAPIAPASYIMFKNHLSNGMCMKEWEIYDYFTTRYCLSVFVAGFHDRLNDDSPLVHMSKDVMEKIVKLTITAPI